MPSLLGAGFVILFLFLLIFAIGILAFIFWISMIVDCAKRKFKDDSSKILWILILIFLGVLGAVIYYFVVKKGERFKNVKRK